VSVADRQALPIVSVPHRECCPSLKKHNEKAKKTKHTVDNIADMEATDRAKWFLNTADNKAKQTRITDFGEQDKPTTTATLRTQQYKTTNSQTLENLLGQRKRMKQSKLAVQRSKKKTMRQGMDQEEYKKLR
jgi:hypothetical protein